MTKVVKQTPPHDDPEQSQRFIDMAHEVETDESPENFEKAFREVTREHPYHGPKRCALRRSREDRKPTD